jgi:hypothetical protein
MLLNHLFEAITRTGKGDTAVVGWGRGMGHKGHMMLASSVITKAKEVGGDPYFVVSRTVGKDDPITPEEKLAIYKKVFPQQGHIFQAASDEIPDLTRVLSNLNQQGYKNAVVVVGEDQVKAFQYLKNYNNKPDKSGNVAFNFDNLDVISRQETGDPSAGEEGPRATPMRQVLMDPSKSEEEQFAVWRDAMNPEVSDEEVLNLMNKAKERMAQFSAPKKKAKATGEDAAGVGIVTKQNATADVPVGGEYMNVKKFFPKKKKVKEQGEADYGADYQDKVKRLGQMAKQGERKTVWDPVKRVYKTVPVNPSKEQGVAEGLPQTLRKVVPGYAKREIDRKMDAGKFGKTDVDKDANFQRYKKIQDKIKEQGVAEVSKSTLDRYVTKAVDAHGHADFAARQSKNDPSKRSYHVDQKKTAEKRRQGISRALDRMSKNEVSENKKQVPISENYQNKIHSLIEKLSRK